MSAAATAAEVRPELEVLAPEETSSSVSGLATIVQGAPETPFGLNDAVEDVPLGSAAQLIGMRPSDFRQPSSGERAGSADAAQPRPLPGKVVMLRPPNTAITGGAAASLRVSPAIEDNALFGNGAPFQLGAFGLSDGGFDDDDFEAAAAAAAAASSSGGSTDGTTDANAGAPSISQWRSAVGAAASTKTAGQLLALLRPQLTPAPVDHWLSDDGHLSSLLDFIVRPVDSRTHAGAGTAGQDAVALHALLEPLRAAEPCDGLAAAGRQLVDSLAGDEAASRAAPPSGAATVTGTLMRFHSFSLRRRHADDVGPVPASVLPEAAVRRLQAAARVERGEDAVDAVAADAAASHARIASAALPAGSTLAAGIGEGSNAIPHAVIAAHAAAFAAAVEDSRHSTGGIETIWRSLLAAAAEGAPHPERAPTPSSSEAGAAPAAGSSASSSSGSGASASGGVSSMIRPVSVLFPRQGEEVVALEALARALVRADVKPAPSSPAPDAASPPSGAGSASSPRPSLLVATEESLGELAALFSGLEVSPRHMRAGVPNGLEALPSPMARSHSSGGFDAATAADGGEGSAAGASVDVTASAPDAAASTAAAAPGTAPAATVTQPLASVTSTSSSPGGGGGADGVDPPALGRLLARYCASEVRAVKRSYRAMRLLVGATRSAEELLGNRPEEIARAMLGVFASRSKGSIAHACAVLQRLVQSWPDAVSRALASDSQRYVGSMLQYLHHPPVADTLVQLVTLCHTASAQGGAGVGTATNLPGSAGAAQGLNGGMGAGGFGAPGGLGGMFGMHGPRAAAAAGNLTTYDKPLMLYSQRGVPASPPARTLLWRSLAGWGFLGVLASHVYRPEYAGVPEHASAAADALLALCRCLCGDDRADALLAPIATSPMLLRGLLAAACWPAPGADFTESGTGGGEGGLCAPPPLGVHGPPERQRECLRVLLELAELAFTDIVTGAMPDGTGGGVQVGLPATPGPRQVENRLARMSGVIAATLVGGLPALGASLVRVHRALHPETVGAVLGHKAHHHHHHHTGAHAAATSAGGKGAATPAGASESGAGESSAAAPGSPAVAGGAAAAAAAKKRRKKKGKKSLGGAASPAPSSAAGGEDGGDEEEDGGGDDSSSAAPSEPPAADAAAGGAPAPADPAADATSSAVTAAGAGKKAGSALGASAPSPAAAAAAVTRPYRHPGHDYTAPFGTYRLAALQLIALLAERQATIPKPPPQPPLPTAGTPASAAGCAALGGAGSPSGVPATPGGGEAMSRQSSFAASSTATGCDQDEWEGGPHGGRSRVSSVSSAADSDAHTPSRSRAASADESAASPNGSHAADDEGDEEEEGEGKGKGGKKDKKGHGKKGKKGHGKKAHHGGGKGGAGGGGSGKKGAADALALALRDSDSEDSDAGGPHTSRTSRGGASGPAAAVREPVEMVKVCTAALDALTTPCALLLRGSPGKGPEPGPPAPASSPATAAPASAGGVFLPSEFWSVALHWNLLYAHSNLPHVAFLRVLRASLQGSHEPAQRALLQTSRMLTHFIHHFKETAPRPLPLRGGPAVVHDHTRTGIAAAMLPPSTRLASGEEASGGGAALPSARTRERTREGASGARGLVLRSLNMVRLVAQAQPPSSFLPQHLRDHALWGAFADTLRGETEVMLAPLVGPPPVRPGPPGAAGGGEAGGGSALNALSAFLQQGGKSGLGALGNALGLGGGKAKAALPAPAPAVSDYDLGGDLAKSLGLTGLARYVDPATPAPASPASSVGSGSSSGGGGRGAAASARTLLSAGMGALKGAAAATSKGASTPPSPSQAAVEDWDEGAPRLGAAPEGSSAVRKGEKTGARRKSGGKGKTAQQTASIEEGTAEGASSAATDSAAAGGGISAVQRSLDMLDVD